ncbi:DUF1836 domain-containing protein [Sutcliffiella deserti]|uniref:DUF1836 domain-containing protein n=1 Tax=Sutcliffiella deserti TaxID=2875501 RepID=UPI001CBA73BA|nr:DUF1836 domain-containing protein [Sutcliffiella deserti]
MAKGWTRLILAEILETLQHSKGPHNLGEHFPESFQKLLDKNTGAEIGLTMTNIVWLGNQLESADYTEPALKNWVKREVKEYIGAPQVGRKYSIQQAALLFIVKDLKVLLDFEAIRKVIGSIFNNPVDRTDDIISPVVFYKAYACLYENLIAQREILSEEHIKEEVKAYITRDPFLGENEKGKVIRALVVAVFAVRTTYLKTLAYQYVDRINGKD